MIQYANYAFWISTHLNAIKKECSASCKNISVSFAISVNSYVN